MNIHSPSGPRLALIAGPTASGKSELALRLAEKVGGVIINADSAQVYADLRLLSARPDTADKMRAPHRLYGTRDGALPCSAAEWAAAAREEIDEAHRAGRLPILVGGTGLYLRTLLDGIAPVPPVDPVIRAEVRALSVAEGRAALEREDPASADRLAPADAARIARALEVVRSTGRSILEWQRRRQGGIGDRLRLAPLLLLPPRGWLYGRCDRRFEAMAGEAGLSEVRALLARGLDPALPVMRAIGVRELGRWCDGEWSREEAVVAGQQATRRYAKRQYTWFAHQPPADWPRFTEALDSEESYERALSILRAALETIA
jgi:tRNA dimethylallyltransferase